MSLINQVLKELDARGTKAIGADSYAQQVRAVPEQQRIHPAWFAAAGAIMLLILVVTWLLLHPVSRQATNPSVPQLALKQDFTLMSAPASVDGVPTASNGQTMSAKAPAHQPAPPNPPLATELHSQSSQAKTASSAASAPHEREHKPPSEASAPVSLALPVKSLTVRSETESAPNATPVISKQFKEPTSQQRADNEYRKALQALQDNKPAEAIRRFESALQLDASHVGARYALISALLDSSRQDEAIAKAREGLTLDLAQPGLSMILSRLQVEKGELRAAIETLERTLPYAADRADYPALLAALLQRDERHKQAIEHYLAALQKMPQNGVWWMGVGISLQVEHRLSEALEAFKRAKASNSLSPELVAFVDTRLAQLQR